jgi:hypothetical protein
MTSVDPALRFVGTFRDYDALIAAIRDHAATLGIPYRLIDELANLATGTTGHVLGDAQTKRLGMMSFLAMTETMGLRGVLYVDQHLVDQMRPHWQRGDMKKAHSKRLARLGRTAMKRVFPAVASEMGKRGGQVRSAKQTAKQRQQLARLGGRAAGRARLRRGLIEAAERSRKP